MSSKEEKNVRMPVTCSQETKDKYQEIRDELDFSHSEMMAYLIMLHNPKFDKGMMMIERTIAIMLGSKEDSEITTNTVSKKTAMRFGKVPNFRTVLQVIEAYKAEIEIHNGEPFSPTYFDKVRSKK